MNILCGEMVVSVCISEINNAKEGGLSEEKQDLSVNKFTRKLCQFFFWSVISM